MMKKFLYLTIAALALVACGDDDHEENNPPQEKQYTKLVTRANMDISQELLHIADITVYYMNEPTLKSGIFEIQSDLYGYSG